MERSEAGPLLGRIARHHRDMDERWWFDSYLRGMDPDVARAAIDELEATGHRVTPAALGDAYRRELQERNARHWIDECHRIIDRAKAKQAEPRDAAEVS